MIQLTKQIKNKFYIPIQVFPEENETFSIFYQYNYEEYEIPIFLVKSDKWITEFSTDFISKHYETLTDCKIVQKNDINFRTIFHSVIKIS